MECVTKYKRIMNIFQKLSKEKRYEELSQLEKYLANWKYKQQILHIHEEQTKKLMNDIKVAETDFYTLLSNLEK